jgi:hypothetical protein
MCVACSCMWPLQVYGYLLFPAPLVALAAAAQCYVTHAALLAEGVHLSPLWKCLWSCLQLLAPHLVLHYLRRQAALQPTPSGSSPPRALKTKQPCAEESSLQQQPAASSGLGSAARVSGQVVAQEGWGVDGSVLLADGQHQVKRDSEGSSGCHRRRQAWSIGRTCNSCGPAAGNNAGDTRPPHPDSERSSVSMTSPPALTGCHRSSPKPPGAEQDSSNEHPQQQLDIQPAQASDAGVLCPQEQAVQVGTCWLGVMATPLILSQRGCCNSNSNSSKFTCFVLAARPVAWPTLTKCGLCTPAELSQGQHTHPGSTHSPSAARS